MSAPLLGRAGVERLGLALSAGRPAPLGATPGGGGVNFALFSARAERVELCLFAPDGRETCRIEIAERDGPVWHLFVAGLQPGQHYGYRVHGPHAPAQGDRFNPAKLLIDPYSRQLEGALEWDDALMGYRVGDPGADLSRDDRDSAPFVPRSVVVAPFRPEDGEVPPTPRPRIPRAEMVIYEAHVRGLTMAHPEVPQELRGSFKGLASEPVLRHLTGLGVTSLQLMPVMAALDDRFLVQRGQRNFWGYNTLGFFAPEPRFMATGRLTELRDAVRRLHSVGIEVILDVVYNHSAESNEMGPTLSFRGLDNRSYYRLSDGGRHYVNDTGTGNTLNVAHPMVLRMVMDSLRYWAEAYEVDGFRFDLGAALARDADGFAPQGAFLGALAQDPVLSQLKLITEPWDLGPGGYRLGGFPHPFQEFNDQFRDGVRRFWRGDGGVADLSRRIAASAEHFDHSGRATTASINFVTVHDGFTLRDLVSYAKKHNEANGEGNRDGADQNWSDNFGTEGPSDDPQVQAARAQRQRNLLATVLLSQGTPFLRGGDEIGNSQGGNNNAYAQDNPTGWVDWEAPDLALAGFVRRLTGLRRAHPVLRQKLFLHSHPRKRDGLPDLFWRLPDGREPQQQDWNRRDWRCLCAEFRTASATPDYKASDDVVLLVFNGGGDIEVRLPDPPAGGGWERLLDSAAPEAVPERPDGPVARIAAQSVAVFALL